MKKAKKTGRYAKKRGDSQSEQQPKEPQKTIFGAARAHQRGTKRGCGGGREIRRWWEVCKMGLPGVPRDRNGQGNTGGAGGSVRNPPPDWGGGEGGRSSATKNRSILGVCRHFSITKNQAQWTREAQAAEARSRTRKG